MDDVVGEVKKLYPTINSRVVVADFTESYKPNFFENIL